jgi:very-short-patch-repair endonuclease
MNIYTCSTCSKSFKSQRSLNSHLNWHKPGYAEKSIAGAQSSMKARLQYHCGMKINRVAEYEANPSKCMGCDIVFSYEKRRNKFCSQSCSASYHNNLRTPQSYERQKDTLRKTLQNKFPDLESRRQLASGKPKRKRNIVIKNCVVCGNEHSTGGKTCSVSCRSKNHSRIMKELIRTGKHNPRLNRGRNKRSYLETSFEEWLTKHGIINYSPEYKVNHYDTFGKYIKTYYIDFYFPNLNLGIELDGTQHKLTLEKDQIRDNYLNSIGIKILRITHAEYIAGTKIDIVKSILGL